MFMPHLFQMRRRAMLYFFPTDSADEAKI